MTDIIVPKTSKSIKNLKKKIRKKENKSKKQFEITQVKDEIVEIENPSKLTNIDEFKLDDGFARFNMDLEAEEVDKENAPKLKFSEDLPRKAISAAILESNHSKEEFEDTGKMSKKKWKRLNRISIGDLKIRVKKPDLVEPFDNCSRDPIFLLELKAKRNTVPVPRHWCCTGKYLQGKRGFVKPPFKLPDCIAKTGIMDMRQTADDKQADKSLKTKMKEKIRPKVGVVDISYEKLYNAFFVDLTKPEMTKFGDIYYQGKELEARRKETRPGVYSDDLRVSLGMPTGPGCEKIPPPWLIPQQRYGPPPSYPNLQIPGLNKGIPPGCSFGFHVGGWGKPPIDDNGKPLYGDVFANAFNTAPVLIDIDAEEDDGKFWGEIDSDADSDKEEDEEENEVGSEKEEGEEEEIEEVKEKTSAKVVESRVKSGTTSLDQNYTPSANIILRKDGKAAEEYTVKAEKQLYKIVPEVKASIGQNIVGSEKLYSMPSVDQKITIAKRKSETVDKSEPKIKKHKEFKF